MATPAGPSPTGKLATTVLPGLLDVDACPIRGNGDPKEERPHRDRLHHRVGGRVDHRNVAGAPIRDVGAPPVRGDGDANGASPQSSQIFLMFPSDGRNGSRRETFLRGSTGLRKTTRFWHASPNAKPNLARQPRRRTIRARRHRRGARRRMMRQTTFLTTCAAFVNPARRILPSMPASVQADVVDHASAVLGIPRRFCLFGTRSKSLALRDERSGILRVYRDRRFKPTSA
jgi:hypothetical protein